MSKFRKYAGIDVRRYVKQADGASYIPWATQLALAGRPTIKIVPFTGTGPVRQVFGGGVVAADQRTEGGEAMFLAKGAQAIECDQRVHYSVFLELSK